MADINIEIILEMLFLSLSNVDMKFDIKQITWRRNTIVEIMPTLKQMELIDKVKFVKATLDNDTKIFIVYIGALENIRVDPLKIPLLGILQSNKALIEVLDTYANYTDVFSPNLIMEISYYIKINKYAIELIREK